MTKKQYPILLNFLSKTTLTKAPKIYLKDAGAHHTNCEHEEEDTKRLFRMVPWAGHQEGLAIITECF